jgi:hypothetical protein
LRVAGRGRGEPGDGEDHRQKGRVATDESDHCVISWWKMKRALIVKLRGAVTPWFGQLRFRKINES